MAILTLKEYKAIYFAVIDYVFYSGNSAGTEEVARLKNQSGITFAYSSLKIKLQL